MIVFPAVDIKEGKCVRLKQGRAGEVTVFSDDPAAMARHWQDQGARWLHVVDLDGAFQGLPANFELIRRLCSAVSVPVQLGGGIRDRQTAANYFQAGVARVIIGTLALEDRETFALICREFPGRVGVSLDAAGGRLKSKGWLADSGRRVPDILPELRDLGAAFVVYTDIDRDGMQSGLNLEAVHEVVQGTDLPVVAAGGVTCLEDIQALFPLSRRGLEGVITGKAIYTGSLDLRQALDWVAAKEQEEGHEDG
jgi:phosphoribosylformimino-5-aminoimidazole carboxamide ribotide isomerase